MENIEKQRDRGENNVGNRISGERSLKKVMTQGYE